MLQHMYKMEVINMSKNIIKKYLVDKIRNVNHFLIMVDEITPFNNEKIDSCVQFVNHDSICQNNWSLWLGYCRWCPHGCD